MAGKLARCLVAAALSFCAPQALADIDTTGSLHREPVDVSSYPWSAIGKLFNEAGGACTGAIIGRDRILTAAHCVYSERLGRFAPASALHFKIGYRAGRAAIHARVAHYETGAGYDPQRWQATMDSDWVILTLSEMLPEDIVPLRLASAAAPRGTRAIIAGYPQDRAHMMTADRDCEVADGTGRLVFHTCRGMRGYSGAPILVGGSGGDMEIAGVHIAMTRGAGAPRMIAVPAPSIVLAQAAILEMPVIDAPMIEMVDEAARDPVVAAGQTDSGWFE
jgi:protease YdgD